MAINYSEIFQPLLDKQVAQEATTGWMETNASLVKYDGGATVKLPKLSVQGMGDYDRSDGYVNGDISLEWSPYTLTQDRGRKFSLDAMDVDETNFVATAGTVMGEFQRTQVVPEIDAYRYSKLAGLAGTSKEVYISAENAFTALLEDLTELEDKIGATASATAIITLSPVTLSLIAQDERFKNLTSEAVLSQGDLNITLRSLNGHPIRISQSALLKTAYVFNDGTTSGQTAGGFTPAANAKDLNWIISAPDAPIAISKTDVIRVFSPTENQKANAWAFDYRKYHDLWVTDNKKVSVLANIQGEAPEPPEK
jgi:hypothetical protein